MMLDPSDLDGDAFKASLNFRRSSPNDESKRGEQKTRLEKRLLLAVVLLFLLMMALIIAISIIRFKYRKKMDKMNNYCRKKECIETASSLLRAMEKTVDPCTDFYTFACGNWAKDHPIKESELVNSWFMEVRKKIQLQILAMLESNRSSTETYTVWTLRTLFESCADTEYLEELGLKPLLQIMNNFSVPQQVPTSKTMANFSISYTLGKIHKLLNHNLFFRVYIGTIENSTTLHLQFSPSTAGRLPVHIVSNPEDERPPVELTAKEELKIVLKYIFKVVHYIGNWNMSEGERISEKEAMNVALKINLVQSHLKYRTRGYNESATEAMTVAELQAVFDQNLESSPNRLDVQEFLDALLEGVNITLDYENTTILVSDLQYFEMLSAALAEENERSIQRYMWWTVVSNLLPYTNSYLANLKRNLIKQFYSFYRYTPRRASCAREATELLPAAVAFEMTQYYPMAETIARVEQMMDDIHHSFRSLVRAVRWMDKKTKMATLEKASAVTTTIGFPGWVQDSNNVDGYYYEVELEEDEYLFNIVRLQASAKKKELENLITDEDIDPTDVNAYYDSFENSITIRPGILHSPFYGRGLEVLNYASIGAVLGHELTHGFDNDGKNYDKDGKRHPWWSPEMVVEYDNKAQCFVKQYGRFNLHGKLKLNGTQTLPENIADNGGLREALMAYRRLVRRRGPEPKLPGLEHYSMEQVFFLAFANMWCKATTPTYDKAILRDSHAPSKFRVIGTLSNMPEFSRAWHCSAEKPMNPPKKCVIW